jgi:hypothetical protein
VPFRECSDPARRRSIGPGDRQPSIGEAVSSLGVGGVHRRRDHRPSEPGCAAGAADGSPWRATRPGKARGLRGGIPGVSRRRGPAGPIRRGPPADGGDGAIPQRLLTPRSPCHAGMARARRPLAARCPRSRSRRHARRRANRGGDVPPAAAPRPASVYGVSRALRKRIGGSWRSLTLDAVRHQN